LAGQPAGGDTLLERGQTYVSALAGIAVYAFPLGFLGYLAQKVVASTDGARTKRFDHRRADAEAALLTSAFLDRGLIVDDGRLQYAWFKVQAEQSIRFHAVALRELAVVPLNLRDDPDVLGKQWAAVRGLYNARVNFAYAAAGIFAPEHIGFVQYTKRRQMQPIGPMRHAMHSSEWLR